MEAGGHHLSTLLLSCFSVWYLLEKRLYTHLVSELLVAAAQGTPLCCLALVVSGSYTHWFHRTLTNEEDFLASYHPQDTETTD